MGPYSHCSDRCFHFEQDNVSSLGWNRKTIRRMLQKSRLGEVLWEVVRIQMYPKGRANKFCCCIRCEVGKEIVKSNVIPKFLAWAAAMNWDGKKAVDWAGVRESIRILILPILSRDIYYISKRRYSIENCGYAALESEKSTLVIHFLKSSVDIWNLDTWKKWDHQRMSAGGKKKRRGLRLKSCSIHIKKSEKRQGMSREVWEVWSPRSRMKTVFPKRECSMVPPCAKS